MGTANNFMLHRSRNVSPVWLCAVKAGGSRGAAGNRRWTQTRRKGAKNTDGGLKAGMCAVDRTRKKKPCALANNMMAMPSEKLRQRSF